MNIKFIKTQKQYLMGGYEVLIWSICDSFYSLYLFDSSESLFVKKDSIETKILKPIIWLEHVYKSRFLFEN